MFLFEHFFELTLTGLALGSVYALVALGYTMVYGVLQLINFAHSEVFMYGTFAVVWTLYVLGGTPATSTGSVIGMLLLASALSVACSAGLDADPRILTGTLWWIDRFPPSSVPRS